MLNKYKVLVLLTFLLALCGCSVSNDSHANMVYLCDYKNINIPREAYWVSEADVNTAMTMYAISTDEDIEDYTGLTDEVVKQHFGYDSVIELRDHALFDIVSHRIIEAAYAQILTTSRMDFSYSDPLFSCYYSDRISAIEYLAEQDGTTVSAFVEENYQLSELEFKESEINFYVTICIIKEILAAEGRSDLQLDIEDYRHTIAHELGCSVEETYKYILNEDIFYSIAEIELCELIAEWYATDIREAYIKVKRSFDEF